MKLRYLLAAALLAAGPAMGQSPKLLVWINGDKAYNGLQKVGDAFEKVSGVKVVVEHPVDATDKFQQAAAAGKGPDIFCWPHDRVGEWAKAGLLTPLRPAARLKAEVEDQAWAAMSYRGRNRGYPLATATTGLIYIIIIGATIFTFLMTLSQLPTMLVGMINDAGLDPWMVIFLLIVVFSALFSWTSTNLLAAEVTLFFWAMVSFAAVPALQINVVTYGKNAPNLVSTLNIAAFNVGNALGAWVGGAVIARGLGLTAVPLAAASLGLVGFLLCIVTFRRAAKKTVKAVA